MNVCTVKMIDINKIKELGLRPTLKKYISCVLDIINLIFFSTLEQVLRAVVNPCQVQAHVWRISVPLLSLNVVEEEAPVTTLPTSSHSGWQHLTLMLSSPGKS